MKYLLSSFILCLALTGWSQTAYINVANVGTFNRVAAAEGGSLALAIDNSAHSAAVTDTQTVPITIGGGANRLLVILFGYGSAVVCPVVTCTFDGTNATAIPVMAGAHNGNWTGMGAYYVLNPRAGAHDIVVALSGASQIQVGGVCFTNANQSTPFGTAITNASNADKISSVTNSSATGEIVLGYAFHDTGDLAPNSGSAIWEDEGLQGGDTSGAAAYWSGAASVTIGFTGGTGDNGWAIGGVPIKPAP